MATASTRKTEIFYPDGDGKPMAETRIHGEVMNDLILSLQDWFIADPLAYVSGNDFVYWVEGNPRVNVSPDVWCVRGIDKTVLRRSYMTWLEGGKAPDLVLEATSRSTRREDQGKKFRIYRDDLKVREYFLFDPYREYLKPPLQGYRLVEGEYRPIEPVAGRLPSEVLGLHLEAVERLVRLHDPVTDRRVLNRLERIEAEKEVSRQAKAQARRTRAELRQKDAAIEQKDAAIEQKDAAIEQKDAAIEQKDAAIEQKDAALQDSLTEIERLRREIEALRAAPKPKPKRK